MQMLINSNLVWSIVYEYFQESKKTNATSRFCTCISVSDRISSRQRQSAWNSLQVVL